MLGFVAPCAAQGVPDVARAAELIVDETNRLRAAQGLAAVASQPELERVARSFAAFMAKSEKYGHDADGSTPAQRVRAAGYRACMVSENIGYQYSSAGFATADLAGRFVRGWAESPGHRRNLLTPEATDIGVALARGERTGRYYAVQVFGRPSSLATRFQVANASSETIRYRLGTRDFDLRASMFSNHGICSGEKLHLPRGRTVIPREGERYVVGGR